MSKYYKGKGFIPLPPAEAKGMQPGPHKPNQTPQKTNDAVHKKCRKCGTVLKDKREYIIDCIDHIHPAMCFGCYE